jgi:hypothetical protein
MTSDRVKSAILTLLDQSKPDASITVTDAQAFADVSLPSLSVGVTSAERHSAALHNVQKVMLEVRLRAHSGDTDTRDDIKSWSAEIENWLNDPALTEKIVNASGNQVECDFWRVDGGVIDWEDTTINVSWQAEAWCRRVG